MTSLIDEFSHDVEVEQNVLCQISLENTLYYTPDLTEDLFYRQAHRIVFRAIANLIEQKVCVDCITLKDELEKMGKIEDVGGLATVLHILTKYPTAAGFQDHLDILKQHSLRRKLYKCLGECMFLAKEPGDVFEISNNIQSKILSITTTDLKKDALESYNEKTASDIMELSEAASRDFEILSTGFTDVDKYTNGLNKSDLIILGGRPAMGKTAFALNITRNLAEAGKRVLFVSLEMSGKELRHRIHASRIKGDSSKVRNPKTIDEKEWERYYSLPDHPFPGDINTFEESDGTVRSIKSYAMKLEHEGGLDAIIVDYLQLMNDPSKNHRDRYLEISAISRGLKMLAREMNIPVLALAQLNRTLETRTCKRPLLSDLRDSGGIEQDADIVMFIHSEQYYTPETEDPSTEIIIAKNRHGSVGTAKLYFDKKTQTFWNYTEQFPDK